MANEVNKIKIKKTEYIDTQYAPSKIVEDKLIKETEYHKEDVYKSMVFIAELIKSAGKNHDFTKFDFFDLFFKDCAIVQDDQGIDFKSLEWYKIHCTEERHHINSKVPKDVNLIDVIELVVDSVVAGLGRSGEINKKYFIIDPDILQEAVWNTALLLKYNCVVDENSSSNSEENE